MGIKIKSTNQSVSSVKAIIYGASGVGKTMLAATAPKPIILSAEAGLLSLAKNDIDSIDVKTVDDVMEAYQWLTESKEAEKYETIMLDSISEISEIYLAALKKVNKDPRAAYGQLATDVTSMIRAFRDITHKHIVFISKSAKIENDVGISIERPMLPGKNLTNGIMYHFDLVMAMRIGKLEDKTTYRYLQTSSSLEFDCKDRSGLLEEIEKPDLGHIFSTIINKTKN